MNALVHPGSVASLGEEKPIDPRAVIEANRAWELDRALMLQRSER